MRIVGSFSRPMYRPLVCTQTNNQITSCLPFPPALVILINILCLLIDQIPTQQSMNPNLQYLSNQFGLQLIIMLTHHSRFFWKIISTMCTNKIKINKFQQNQPPQTRINQANRPYRFRIKMDRVSDPTYFMDLINNQHSLNQTNRMLNAILSGGTGLSISNFQSIFKKYSYYIEQLPGKQSYNDSNMEQKIKFLDYTTQIYYKFGRLSSKHIIKTLNKVSDQIFQKLQHQMHNQKQQFQIQQTLSKVVLCILSVSRYNPNKSFILYKKIQHKFLKNQKVLSKINVQSSLSFMELYSNLHHFNRLVIEICIDALNQHIQDINYQDLYKILYCLASSQFPVNRHFVQKIIKRVKKQLDRQVDPKSGIAYQKNMPTLRQHIKVLSSLSLIEVNMNLASCYLLEFTSILQVELYDLANYIKRMSDKDLQGYVQILRRCCFYDKNLLLDIIEQVFSRKVRELEQLDFEFQANLNDDLSEKGSEKMNKDKLASRYISINTICEIIHTLAIYNFRHQGLIEYFTKIIQLLAKRQSISISDQKLITNNNMGQANRNLTITSNEQTDMHSRRSQKRLFSFSNIIKPKYYSRVVWALCIIGQKQQLSKIYPIFQQHFSKNSQAPQVQDTVNFYYSYLLLKTYFPKNTLSFDKLINHLQSQQLTSNISQTHQIIHNQFIVAGIPALKQHNLSNLMCDIFVPEYTNSTRQYQVNNVVIDIHGHHHFMRNCDRLKGGSILKQKILKNQGYIYQYLGVHQWELSMDKNQFIILLMDGVAEKYGKKIDKRIHRPKNLIQNNQNFKQRNNEKGTQRFQGKLINFQFQQQIKKQRDEQQTTRIPTKIRRGRNIRTNSAKLQAKLNKIND